MPYSEQIQTWLFITSYRTTYLSLMWWKMHWSWRHERCPPALGPWQISPLNIRCLLSQIEELEQLQESASSHTVSKDTRGQQSDQEGTLSWPPHSHHKRFWSSVRHCMSSQDTAETVLGRTWENGDLDPHDLLCEKGYGNLCDIQQCSCQDTQRWVTQMVHLGGDRQVDRIQSQRDRSYEGVMHRN